MNPQCFRCGKIVALHAGLTTEIDVKQEYIDQDRPRHIYLCVACGGEIEHFKSYPWYAGHRIV